MAREGRELYDGTWVWLAFCGHDSDPLIDACSSLEAAKQALDERLRCYDLRGSWAGEWEVGSVGHDGPRTWKRTASVMIEPGNGRQWEQTIRREPVRRELPPREPA